MKIRSKWGRTAAVLAAGAMILTACDGGDGDDPGGDDTGGEEMTDGEDMSESEAPADDGTEDQASGGGDVTTGDGVTAEPCPDAVNEDNGCIYLGVISDLTQGPFSAAGPAIVDAQRAFWRRVNEQGGIGGEFDVNIDENVRDNLYAPQTHNQVYQEMKPDILALAQSLGSPTTAAILDDLKSSNIVAAPASWTSGNEFEDVILESGNNYCVEAINALDYRAQEAGDIESVLAVHLPGDYGGDGAAGAKKWADANGASFNNVQVTDSTDAAVGEINSSNPDVVFITLGPTQTAEVVGGAAGRGYQGFFIGSSPTWNPALLASAAGDAFRALYWQAGPWQSFGADTPAHQAMRDQLEAMSDELESYSGPEQVTDFYTAGWAWSYPLLRAIESAYESGDLTREGVFAAVETLDSADYEGMLPDAAGDFTGSPAEQSFNQTVISSVSDESPTGVVAEVEFFEGETVSGIDLEEPCFISEGFGA